MGWKPVPTPDFLNECACGSDDVETQADGIVREYRCADCGTFLGDATIGHEP